MTDNDTVDNPRQRAEWITEVDEEDRVLCYFCTACDSDNDEQTNFCPFCGADMRKGKRSKQTNRERFNSLTNEELAVLLDTLGTAAEKGDWTCFLPYFSENIEEWLREDSEGERLWDDLNRRES